MAAEVSEEAPTLKQLEQVVDGQQDWTAEVEKQQSRSGQEVAGSAGAPSADAVEPECALEVADVVSSSSSPGRVRRDERRSRMQLHHMDLHAVFEL